MISNKEPTPIVTELIIRGRKLNISTAFIAKPYSQLPQDFRINCMTFLLWKSKTNESFNKSN